jgi:pantoate--beta-alanine ligase
MVILHSLEALHEWQDLVGWAQRETGFVPTMGALHEGHLSLIENAVQRTELVVVSVLVNPTQFNDAKDFDRYPRTLESDAEKAKNAGAHAVFAPTAEDLYGGTPEAPRISWGNITDSFEGAFRKGHFDGVIKVVDLLFQAVRPKVAVFGAKDLQQVAVVKRMARERHPGVSVVVGALIRDADGLALSSRNVRLNEEGVQLALTLSRTLFEVRRRVEACAIGEDLTSVLDWARSAASQSVELEYLDLVDADTFDPTGTKQNTPMHVIVAASVQGVRLIDNLKVN